MVIDLFIAQGRGSLRLHLTNTLLLMVRREQCFKLWHNFCPRQLWYLRKVDACGGLACLAEPSCSFTLGFNWDWSVAVQIRQW